MSKRIHGGNHSGLRAIASSSRSFGASQFLQIDYLAFWNSNFIKVCCKNRSHYYFLATNHIIT